VNGGGRRTTVETATDTTRLPFMDGLSYSRFEYRNLAISPSPLPAGKPARVSVEVRNAGSRAADEVAQRDTGS
jgi:hypothetical protein